MIVTPSPVRALLRAFYHTFAAGSVVYTIARAYRRGKEQG